MHFECRNASIPAQFPVTAFMECRSSPWGTDRRESDRGTPPLWLGISHSICQAESRLQDENTVDLLPHRVAELPCPVLTRACWQCGGSGPIGTWVV